MELFKLNDDFLVDINKEWIQLHEPFKKLYLRDKGNNSLHYKGRYKSTAQKEFTYIYLLCDYRSNLINYSEEDRKIEAKKTAGLDNVWKIDKEVQDAIDHYYTLQDTRPLKLLNACYKKVDNLTKLLNTDDQEIDIKVLGDTIKAMSDISKLLKTLKDLEEQTKKELSETANSRGNIEIGENEL